MSFDPFGDFETTGYLRNSLGLKDPAEVKENEHFSFEMGLDEALSYLERTKNLNYQALLQVHRLLFEKFYPGPGVTVSSWSLIFLSGKVPRALPDVPSSKVPLTCPRFQYHVKLSRVRFPSRRRQ